MYPSGEDTNIPPPLVHQLQLGRYQSKSDKEYEYAFFANAAAPDTYKGVLEANPDHLDAYSKFFAELYRAMDTTGRDTLIVIHGCSHPFSKFMNTLSLVDDGYVSPTFAKVGHIIGFSWCARGDLKKYDDDTKDAIASGATLHSFLSELIKFVQTALSSDDDRNAFYQRLNLVAISMGNLILEECMKLFAKEKPLRIFNEVLHAAADIDAEAYEPGRPLTLLLNYARRVHVYFTGLDVVLAASELVEHSGKDRLGRYGRTPHTVKDDCLIYVDASWPIARAPLIPDELANHDELGYPTVHSYFVKVKTVKRDALQIFKHLDTDDIAGRIHLLGSYRIL